MSDFIICSNFFFSYFFQSNALKMKTQNNLVFFLQEDTDFYFIMENSCPKTKIINIFA